MNAKSFLKKYAPLFVGVYIGAFFLLVTFHSRFDFPTLPGDILIQGAGLTFYFPLVSSLGVAAFATVMFEAYKLFKHV